MTHLDAGLKALGKVNKGGSGTSMQSSLVEDYSIEEVRIISFDLLGGRCRRSLTSQGFDDITRISCLSQACHLLLVTQHSREPTQYLNVFIRFSRDPHNQEGGFAGIPGHSRGYLHH